MTQHTKSKWESIVQRWRASRLTARDFATREGLNAATLRWWSSRLSQPPPPSGFIELQLAAPAPTSALSIVLRDGLRIEVSESFDPELLRRVVTALESR
jgi:hypothetical protein